MMKKSLPELRMNIVDNTVVKYMLMSRVFPQK